MTLRLRATAATPRPKLSAARKLSTRIDAKAGLGKRSIYWAELEEEPRRRRSTTARSWFRATAIRGPAVVETHRHHRRRASAGARSTVDAFGNFEIHFETMSRTT